MKWIFISAFTIATAIMGYFYLTLQSTPPPPVVITAATSTRTLLVLHAFKDGEHRFDGQIKLPHSCYSLDAQAELDPKNPDAIVLALTSTDKMLDQALCAEIPTNYQFEALVDAPEDAAVSATLNGNDLPITLKEIDWESAAGSYFNPIFSK